VERLDCKVKRVFFAPHIPSSFQQNPKLLTSTLATKYLTRNTKRNEVIVDNLIRAASSGRKILVLSHIRDNHIVPLERMFRESWPGNLGACPSTSFYVGGMKDDEFDEAERAQVIFGTVPMAKEGLDIPPLDTLFLTTPLGNVEQAVGRIQRNYPGKKDPMVVDFRDDTIAVCRRLGNLRWKFYERKGWVGDAGSA
jgi:superfamily II DNA or RNA helicase